MKKLISLLLCFSLLLCVCSCGKENTETESTQQSADVLDLTQLSSTMVYSEVYNMVNTPTDYLGRTVKVNGMFVSSPFEDTGKDYFYIIVADATSCCQQGLEFIWTGDHSYPDDYPTLESQIEITGVFSTYNELGVDYYYIKTDAIKVL